MKAFIAVTHLLGSGHLTRAAALARALAERGHTVTLASGGRPNPLVSVAGLDFVQLPPVAATPDDLATLRDGTGAAASPNLLAARQALLLSALRRVEPDALVTEHFPFGRRSLAAEFLALLDAGSALRRPPVLVGSVRDVLVRPDKEAKIRRAHDILRERYDAVLVHGDPNLLPLDASWPVDEPVRHLLRYTGYVDTECPEATLPVEPGRGDIVVSGGSSAAGLPLYRAAIQAASLLPGLRWRILAGGGIPIGEIATLAGAAGPNVVVEPARPDFRRLLRGAALFVGQAGYNTVLDLVASGVPALLVPFERGQETEQRLRADALAAKGVAALLPEAELSGPTLAVAVEKALDRPPQHNAMMIDRAGAHTSVGHLEELVVGVGKARVA